MLSHSLLAAMVSDEKSVVNLIGFLVSENSFFTFCFHYLYYDLSFLELFTFILLGVCWDSWVHELKFSSNLRSFQTLFLRIFFLFFLLLPLSPLLPALPLCMLSHLMVSHISLRISSFFFFGWIFLFSFCTFQIQNLHLFLFFKNNFYLFIDILHLMKYWSF